MDSSGSSSRDERIDTLIADYLEKRERGTAPPDNEWLAAHSEFRQELQEFLSGFRGLSVGQAVRAYREPLVNRLQRFLRRHQTLSTSVTAAAMIAALSFGVGSWLLGRANERERAARNDADQSFRLAHESVNKYFTEVAEDDRLLQADLRPLRKELLNSAREYYEQFIAERSDDPTLRAEMGMALGRLAHLVLETEPRANALPHYDRAIEMFEELTTVHRDNSAYWNELATVYNDVGNIYQEMGRLDDAEQRMLASLEIRERLAKNDKSATAQSDFAATLGNVGIHYRTRGQLDASEQHLLRSNEMWSELLQDPKNSKLAEFQSKAAQARYLLGNLYFTHASEQGPMKRAVQPLAPVPKVVGERIQQNERARFKFFE
jgi:tetratricopeptide (TPR) repeat protein